MSPVNAADHLERLKDFQRRTVEYVFQRMYEDDEPAHRFLVADEVGLGKTLVARGLVAKVIEHLHRQGQQSIHVVYICSNAAIAAQNLRRLDVLGDQANRKTFATRLTMLPMHVHALDAQQVNFISFTPSTTFSLRSRGGWVAERAVLFEILRTLEGVDRKGLRCLLRDRVGWGNWKKECAQARKRTPDPTLAQRFRAVVEADAELSRRIREGAAEWRGEKGNDQPWPKVDRRLELVGDLRAALSRICLDALRPDLVILDEFQRFKKLLARDGSEEAELAEKMFQAASEAQRAPRILLLSATPYKMYTVPGEVSDDHYADLFKTLEFLVDHDEPRVDHIARGLTDYRRCLTRAVEHRDEAHDAALRAARGRTQHDLLQVMVRTERTASMAHRDAMVEEFLDPAPPNSIDFDHYMRLDRLVRAAGGHDVVEYWKSAPYLVDFMKGYDLSRRLAQHTENTKDAVQGPPELSDALRALQPHRLQQDHVDAYRPIDAGTPRLRSLLKHLEDSGLMQLLWLPPSLTYLAPNGAYATAPAASKSLVFSAWNVVPDAIAAITSYQTERRMLGEDTALQRHSTLTRERRGLLRYSVTKKGYRGMGALLLQLPSPFLAEVGDPLVLAREHGGDVGREAAIRNVAGRILEALDELKLPTDPSRPGTDRRWYWAAVAALDARHHSDVLDWLTDPTGAAAVVGPPSATEGTKGFGRVVERYAATAQQPEPLGARPEDLGEVLAELALAAPGTCALRALQRQTPSLPMASPDLLHGAAEVGEGFRTLFNVPETMGLLGAFRRHRAKDDHEEDDDYWRRCLGQGLDGNLQAVLDEQAHVLHDSLGFDRSTEPTQVATGIAAAMADALSIRTANLFVDDIRPAPDRPGWLERPKEPFSLRTRFGLRLGDLKGDGRRVHRVDVVRKAFNSPFRPFLLASTSVGQEGLDFHTWCHVVHHWNLPTNPVDMEQREGRVHRYKGLAVRRNLAAAYRQRLLHDWDGCGDPWAWMFDAACSDRDEGLDEMVPYWLFADVPDGKPQRVERRVPILPLSKESERYAALKRSLVFYRLAFGQPRQGDLVQWLQSRLGNDDTSTQLVDDWRIDLRAPG